MKHNINTIIYSIIVLLFFAGCSTKKNTFVNRTYHDVTAHYNAWWNGNESLKEGVASIEKNYKDNYLFPLPIYRYANEEQVSSVYPQMNRAIEKATKVIKNHSMQIKGNEYCKWIDNSFLLMGQAQFYKRDYSQAQRTFSHILNSYKTHNKYNDAAIWSARTAIQQKEYTRARNTLNEVIERIDERELKFYQFSKRRIVRNAYLAYAESYEAEGNHEAAIQALEKAISLRPKHSEKIRYKFILAQLYQETGNPDKAGELYSWVLRRNTSYDMTFNASINLAKSYKKGETAKKAQIMKSLDKLMNDPKNIEYHDQIYYAKAEVELIDGNIETGITYLKQSVEASVANDYQKTFSALKLADIYFERSEYENAQNYYDIAIQTLPKNYPNYNAIVEKTKVLNELVSNLRTIHLEDSLQRLSKMTPAQQNAIVEQIINKYTEDERIRKAEEAERTRLLNNIIANSQRSSRSTSSTWYFYNTQTLNQGLAEFRKKWGNRKLEDNWRIANKQQIFDEAISMDNTDEESETDESDSTATTDKKEKKFDPTNKADYLKNIPSTPEQIEKSNARIAEAYYSLGAIYRDYLNDLPKSIEAYDSLTTRYPKHQYALPCYYNIYQLCTTTKQYDKAEEAKQYILKNYPNSDYAKLIKDPDYYKHIAERQDEANLFYSQAYTLFENEQWSEVIAKAEQAQKTYENKDVLAKITYLQAISYYKLNNLDGMRSALNNLLANYSGSELDDRSQKLLAMYPAPNQPAAATSSDKETTANTPATNQPVWSIDDGFHFFVIIANIQEVNINNLKNNISDYNKSYFPEENFDVNSRYLDDRTQMITVSRMKNKAKAMEYYKAFRNADNLMKQVSGNSSKIYLMSSANYVKYYKEKGLRESYDLFFETQYK